MGWLRRLARGLKSGAGAGLLTAGLGAIAGDSSTVTLGVQMATAGVVKKVSKAAGREVHRIGSPLASLAVLAVAKKLGSDMPVELAAVGADPGAVTNAVQFLLNGVLPSGIQSTAKNSGRAVRDYARRRAW